MKYIRSARLLGLTAALTLAASQGAWAQNVGWYGGLNAGRTAATIDDARISNNLRASGFTGSSIQDDDRSTGFKVFGGYQLNRNFAIEGGYFDLGKFGYTATTTPPGTLTGDIKLRGLNLDLVGTLPVTDRFSAFGRVGLNYAEARDTFRGTGAVTVRNPNPSTRDTNFKIGAGLQYAVTDALSLRGEIERYRVNDAVGNRGHVDMVSVGLVYYFGAKAAKPTPYVATVAPMPMAEPVAPMPAPAPLPPPRIEKYTLSATELFEFDRADLRGAQPKLDEVAAALASSNTVGEIVITGYTDRLGSDRYNQALSERRADAVKSYLTSKGVAANRLRAQGRGEANPVVACSDKRLPALIQCLEPNRRVEVEQFTVDRPVR
jgi:OOP family OmpA-OmpF porin